MVWSTCWQVIVPPSVSYRRYGSPGVDRAERDLNLNSL
jgi:hypothetical protein